MRRFLPVAPVLWALAASMASAITRAADSTPLTTPEVGTSVLRVFGAFLLVIGLFFGCVWLFRQYPNWIASKGRPSKLHIMEMKSLGPRQSLFVIAYEGQRLLLASSPAGVSFLSRLPDADPSELPPPVPKTAFTEALQQVLARKS